MPDDRNQPNQHTDDSLMERFDEEKLRRFSARYRSQSRSRREKKPETGSP